MNTLVELLGPGSMIFSHILKQSPLNWETSVCQNVALTVFHAQNIRHHALQTLRTSLLFFIVL